MVLFFGGGGGGEGVGCLFEVGNLKVLFRGGGVGGGRRLFGVGRLIE